MRKLLIAAVLGLVGCVQTPSQVLQEGNLYEVTSSRSAQDAAQCLSANSDRRFGSFTVQELRPNAQGVIETRFRAGDSGVIGVSQIEPRPTGSTIKLRVSGMLMNDTVARELLKGC